jgi:hypothetical protein
MDEAERHEHHTETQPQVFRGEGQTAQDRFGSRTRRAAVAEMVLDTPRRIEAQLVGELNLLDRLVVGALFGVSLAVRVGQAPGLDLGLELVQQIELHLSPFYSSFAIAKGVL